MTVVILEEIKTYIGKTERYYKKMAVSQVKRPQKKAAMLTP